MKNTVKRVLRAQRQYKARAVSVRAAASGEIVHAPSDDESEADGPSAFRAPRFSARPFRSKRGQRCAGRSRAPR